MTPTTQEPGALSQAECLALLGSAKVGRVIYTAQALPAVEPVRFILDGDRVMFWIDADSRLARAVTDTIVAFEADHLDAHSGRGWTVTVIGRARPEHEPAEATSFARLVPREPAGSTADQVFVLPCQRVSGHRLGVSHTATSAA